MNLFSYKRELQYSATVSGIPTETVHISVCLFVNKVDS